MSCTDGTQHFLCNHLPSVQIFLAPLLLTKVLLSACPATIIFIVMHFSFILRIPDFGGSDEAVAAEKILECFDQGDAQGMKTCTSQAIFTYLDNEVLNRV